MVVPTNLQIGHTKVIGSSEPCFIIAEAGQNHQGDLEIAKQLIIAAKKCGADCVKFQKTYLPEKFNGEALARSYTGPNSWGKTYGEHKEFLEFSFQQFRELQNVANDVGILFTASAMDSVSADFLDTLDVPFIKIGSGDANNFPLLEHVATKGRPMIVSSGMQNMSTVHEIYATLKSKSAKFCILHCVSSYPTPPAEVNLRVIETFQKEFPDIHIGYSGHELGNAISIAAVAMGARVLERHLTLDNSWKGSDHMCSLTPNKFEELVTQIRTVECAMGTGVKAFQPSEQPCYDKLGKTLVAAHKLPVGTVLQLTDVKVKVAEPKGCPAELIKHIMGKRLNCTVEKDQSISLMDIQL